MSRRGRVTDVIEVSDSDSDAPPARRRRGASSSAAATEPSAHMRRPSEWAFLESASEASAEDSDDFERRPRKGKTTPPKPKSKAAKAKSPAKAKASKPKPRAYSDEYEEIDERPRRVAQRHLFSDHLTVSELQAQEREMARLKALSVRNQAIAALEQSHASSSNSRRTSESASYGKVTVRPSPTHKPVTARPTVPPKHKTAVNLVSPVRPTRTVLATTLARKQNQQLSSPPVTKKKTQQQLTPTRSSKRRRDYSEEEEEEEGEEEDIEEDSDDFVDDIVEAKKAALRASLELAKKKKKTTPTASRVPVKSVVSPLSPPPSPPPPRRSSVSKSKTTKKTNAPPTPPPRPSPKSKKSKKSKEPPRKRRELSPPPAEVPRESRRKSDQGLISDFFSVSELQAQEREWSRLQRDLKFQELSTTTATTAPTPSSAKAKQLDQRSRRDRPSRSSQREPASTESDNDSVVEMIEIFEDEDEEDANDDADYVHGPSKKASKSKSRSKKTPSVASRSGTPSVPRSSPQSSNGSSGNTKPADVLAKPRTAAETVPHGSLWRRYQFKSAPVNLLPLSSSLSPPFESAVDRPLIEFDTSGDLKDKCRILSSFGKTKSFLLTSDPSKPEVSQDTMNERVMELLETWTPRIKSCYERKSEAIVREARGKTAEYVRLRDEHIESIVGGKWRLHAEKIPVDRAESMLAKQLATTEHVSPLLNLNPVKLGRGETFLVEKEVIPETCIELTPIRQISRSTTYIGVKSSVRVEDDPILRYVPYFGDNDNGDAIDVKAYDSVRAKDTVEGVKSANGLDNEAHEYMLRLVIAEYGDLETVFNALKHVAGFGQPYTEYCEIKKRLDAHEAARKRMQEIKDFIEADQSADSKNDDAATRAALKELTQGLHPFADSARAKIPLGERLASHWTYFDTNLLPSSTRPSKAFRSLLGLRHTNDYADLSETYRDLFCRMCYKYDCPEHGIEHPMPTRRVDPLYPSTRYAPLDTSDGGEKEKVEDENALLDNEPEQDGLQEKSAATTASDITEVIEVTNEGDEGDVDRTQATDATDLVSECSATTVESQETVDLSATEPRRSSRSGTRASTLASISVEAQLAALGFKTRSQRTQRSKVPAKRPTDDESEYLDNSHRPIVSSNVKKFLEEGEVCGDCCWKSEQSSDETKPAGDDEFTEPEEEIKSRLNAAELLVLQKLRYTVGDNACMIASVLRSLSCRDIHTYMISQRRNKPADQQGYFSPDVSGKKNRKRGRAAAALPGNNRELLKRTRHQRLKDTASSNHDYEPCNHEGICDFGASCSCMKRDHMCEKACSCSRDCPNRFQGCKCSMGNCRTAQCPCFVAMRECNPDLCHSCGASDVPVLVYNPEYNSLSSQHLGICCNVNVQRGLHKKLGVSYSRTHGWGAFALEPIKKGEFIYEYTGAIISHDEAERRGSIYDKLNISFLFDLNEDSVADAVRTGNKSKFCNHANVGQKCHARIFRIGGEHHVSIWASADIRKGEELFFNYGYHGESAPVWSQGARITSASRFEAEETVVEIAADDEHEVHTIE